MMLFASYGSLKKGFWNNIRFGLEEPIAKGTVRGAMFMNAGLGYPWLFNEKDSIEKGYKIKDYDVEIFEVSEEKFNRIDMMEIGSGYKAEKLIFPAITEMIGREVNATVWFADPTCINPKVEQWIEDYRPKI